MNFDRILILDGAMGTMLQKHGLSGDSELFNLTRPEIIESIHRDYVEAGADIIETNTFGASYKTALAGARIARKVADESKRKVWVAGSVGPTSKSLSMSINVDLPAWRPVSFDEMAASYREQIRGLAEGGVDFLLIETAFDALNVKAAIYAAEGFDLPIMISASANDKSGRTLTGQTIEAFYTAIKHCHPIAFGLNCSLGAVELQPLIAEVSSFADCAVSCYPNAGLPNEMGTYDQSPQAMADAVRAMALSGNVNIVGGCCGTTPEHIRAIAEAVKDIRPREITGKRESLTVSGLESHVLDVAKSNFTNVGERTNVAGSRKFAKLIAAGDYQSALDVAAQQIANGASVIDINMDDAMLDSTAQMQEFVRWTTSDPAVSKAALMIDSSHWDTILAGLKNAQGKCIVNSISLKEGEEAFLTKAREILRLGAAVVVMAFDENGQATDFKRKIEISERAYHLLTGIGFSPSDIIFDVNVLTVGTGVATDRKYGIDFIEAVRWIKKNLSGALTSGGISNLSFAFRGNNPVREAMHSVFLYHAIKAGLDMAIVNPGMLQIYDDIEPKLRKACEDVILDSDEGASERLLAVASEALAASKTDTTVPNGTQNQQCTKDSLSMMLVKGRSENLEEKVLAAMNEYGDAKAVIEGPLMAGMERVGELFGDGRMFLPQVVKSAKVMKEAVAILQPYLDTNNATSDLSGQKNTVVIATVKGDVHDIGKNITATVLQCNGFRVVDLGVMVDNDTILEAAARENADIIATSGLITPSLGQMEDLCRMMSERRMKTPLFIGGATTSALHTAVKLAPLYEHVFYGPDASASAVLAKKYILNPEKFEAEEHSKQAELREIHQRKNTPTERKNIFDILPAEGYLPLDTLAPQDYAVGELPLEEVAGFIDWNTFYAIWRIKASDTQKPQVQAIRKEAMESLKTLKCQILGATHFLKDGIGVFAAAVHPSDSTLTIESSLKLCLAEAASAWLQSRLQVPAGYKVIFPGIGYASCPDHSLKKDVLSSIPDHEKLGISLTESYSMLPDASVCGYIIVHKEARYL